MPSFPSSTTPSMLNVSWTTAILLSTVTSIGLYLTLKKKRLEGQRLPPCLPSLPLIGSIPFLPTDFLEAAKYFLNTSAKLGPVLAYYSGKSYTVVLNGREAVEEALVKRAHDFADRSIMYVEKMYSNPNEKGIVNEHFTAEYKRMRRQIMSTLRMFGLGKVQLTESKVHTEFRALMDEVEKMGGRSFYPDNLVSNVFSNIAFSIFFGHRFEHDDPIFQQINDSIRNMAHTAPFILDVVPTARFLPKVRKQISNFCEHLERFFEAMNVEIEACLRNSTDDCFVKNFVEAVGEKCDRENLLFILRDLFVGGVDAPVSLLLWGITALANHPDVQNNIRREISSNVPKSRLPSLDDKPNLPYTEASIAELMRRKTIFPLALPHMTLNDSEVNGCFIPAGAQVLINLYSAHMDPKVWPDPEQFKPDRFLDEDGKFVGGERVIAFSLGKRSCIGEVLARQAFFLTFASLVQQFEILPPEGQTSVDVVEVCDGFTTPSYFEVRLIPSND